MTDLRGTRHVALSRFLARYFKYTRETLNAPLENNEFIVRRIKRRATINILIRFAHIITNISISECKQTRYQQYAKESEVVYKRMFHLNFNFF